MLENIQKALTEAIRKEAEEIAKKCVGEFEKELSQKIAGLALSVSKEISIASTSDNLIITIRK